MLYDTIFIVVMIKNKTSRSDGFTITELIVTIVVFGFVMVTVFGLLQSFLAASATASLRAHSLAIATEKMEELRSLPYDRLAVAGGSIITSGTPLPASQSVVRGSRTYTVAINITYADDAYDGCLNYPSGSSYLCRNGPPATGTPIDTNPRDYKIAEVGVTDALSGVKYSTLSSIFTARVAETGGNTSAIMTQVIDGSGNPIGGATVRVRNTALSPAVDQSAVTDSNGVALFLDITPDSQPRYTITASKAGYSTLTTSANSGSLVATYPNVNALVQQVSSSTLMIDVVSPASLKVSTVNTSNNPLPGTAFTIKGGYKTYTDPADQTYSMSQTVTTDSNAEATFSNLVPGNYIVCYGANDTCGGSQYLAVTRVAFGALTTQPITVPAGTTVASNGYMQTAQLVLVGSAGTPRIRSTNPATLSLASSDIGASLITISGSNLAGAVVRLVQGATVITGSVSGVDSATQINREFNMSAAPTGPYDIQVTVGGVTLSQSGVTPGTNGGVNVTP